MAKGRPRRNGVKLSTKVPPHVLAGIRQDAAERGGSLGDAVTRFYEQAKHRDQTIEAMRQERDAAVLEAKSLLVVARRLDASNKAKDERWAKADAMTKARARRAPSWL